VITSAEERRAAGSDLTAETSMVITMAGTNLR
jgi:hypothetical protein